MYKTWGLKKQARQEGADTVNLGTHRVEGALRDVSAGGFGSSERPRSYE